MLAETYHSTAGRIVPRNYDDTLMLEKSTPVYCWIVLESGKHNKLCKEQNYELNVTYSKNPSEELLLAYEEILKNSTSITLDEFIHEQQYPPLSLENEIGQTKNLNSELIKKVESFSLLKSGWGGKNSVAPTSIAVSQARQFIDLLPTGAPLPHVSVAEDGEINFMWRSDAIYIDVGIYGDSQIHYYVHSETKKTDKDSSERFSIYSIPKDIITAIAEF